MTIQDNQLKNDLYTEQEIRVLEGFSIDEIKKVKEILLTQERISREQKSFNENHNHNGENGSKINFNDLLFGKLKIATFSQDVIDDGTIDLPNATCGIGFVSAQGEEACLFTWTTAGAVSLVANTTNAVNTDTDTKLCVFDNGTYVRIKNRLGATKLIKYLIIY